MQISEEAERISGDVVKISERAAAKKYGIEEFPTLAFVKGEQIETFDG